MTNKYKFTYVELGKTWGEHKGNDGGFELNWAAEGIGFGQLVFFKDAGSVKCTTECMGKEFVKAALIHFFKTVELINK